MDWKAISRALRPATCALLAAAAVDGLASSPATAAEILGLEVTAAAAEGEDYLDPFREMVFFEDYMLTITAAEAFLVRNDVYSANVAGIQRYLPGAAMLANATTPTPYFGEPIDGWAVVRGQVGYTVSQTSDCNCNSAFYVTGFGSTSQELYFSGTIRE